MTFEYECKLGHVTELSKRQKTTKCSCGQTARRIISRPAFLIPAHMTAEGDRVNGAGRAKQQEYLKRPEVRKKLMDGELIVDKD